MLRLSGQITSKGDVESMAQQVQLADDVNTDTGVARKSPAETADLANKFADLGLGGFDASMFEGL